MIIFGWMAVHARKIWRQGKLMTDCVGDIRIPRSMPYWFAKMLYIVLLTSSIVAMISGMILIVLPLIKPMTC